MEDVEIGNKRKKKKIVVQVFSLDSGFYEGFFLLLVGLPLMWFLFCKFLKLHKKDCPLNQSEKQSKKSDSNLNPT